MTMKAHTYYIIFGRPPIGGKLPPSPLAAPLVNGLILIFAQRTGLQSVEPISLCATLFTAAASDPIWSQSGPAIVPVLVRSLSVCLSVGHDREPYKNG